MGVLRRTIHLQVRLPAEAGDGVERRITELDLTPSRYLRQLIACDLENPTAVERRLGRLRMAS